MLVSLLRLNVRLTTMHLFVELSENGATSTYSSKRKCLTDDKRTTSLVRWKQKGEVGG